MKKQIILLGMMIIILFALNLVMGSVRIPVGDVIGILMGAVLIAVVPAVERGIKKWTT